MIPSGQLVSFAFHVSLFHPQREAGHQEVTTRSNQFHTAETKGHLSVET